jgi:beta-phosphoglucomutase-like phosphatase (HAD superfamily)
VNAPPVCVRALIWDFDGLIAPTEDMDCQAWREEFDRAGVPVSVAAYARMWDQWAWHRQVRMIDHLIARAPGPVDEDEVTARRLARYRELCAALPATPGITEWLHRARELGLATHVATNDVDVRAAGHLARLGLAGLAGPVVSARDGIARKPAPDLYLAALNALGVPAGDAAAVEDSPHGAAAALAAGVRVVAVPNQVTARLNFPAGTLIIADPAGTPLDEVLAMLDRAAARVPREPGG